MPLSAVLPPLTAGSSPPVYSYFIYTEHIVVADEMNSSRDKWATYRQAHTLNYTSPRNTFICWSRANIKNTNLITRRIFLIYFYFPLLFCFFSSSSSFYSILLILLCQTSVPRAGALLKWGGMKCAESGLGVWGHCLFNFAYLCSQPAEQTDWKHGFTVAIRHAAPLLWCRILQP